ncbi:hypothetical protein Ddye_019103 [Dipteronia dyeriana]|uniref:Brf1 TBP-binding domain-containing protein n=1 Tax=Dipteronia dyeriana TaxID=168575 RepID=A0AAD9WVC2_9ROSI|nr:hypothetical protein Ddye_019103 [Dipteronia dyeriana]
MDDLIASRQIHHGKRDDCIKDVPDGDDADNSFDSDAFEIDDDLLDEDEKHYKNIIQAILKWQYFKDREEKEEAAMAAKEDYEQLKAVLENDVAALNSVKERQQKLAVEAGYPASAESASEPTLRMLSKKRLSSKINDDVLEEVYNDLVASENTERRESEPHSDNGNKRLESEDAFKIGDLELEGYLGNGGSVGRRRIWKPNGRRGIWRTNGLRKCTRKLSS